MRKIYVNKSDSVAAVVSKILKVSDEAVVLYIPRSTNFASSRNNLLLLKRETETAGKTLVIESVDDDILELADTVGIKAVNPFIGRRQKAVSDIVAVGPRPAVSRLIKQKEKEAEDGTEAEETAPPLLIKEDEELGEEQFVSSPKRFLIALVATSFLTIALVFLFNVLPRAKIDLTFEKMNLDFVGTLNTSAAIETNSFNNTEVKLRGVSFLEKRNVTKPYRATGKKYIERRATGPVVLSNGYNALPQVLIAGTRLVTPDGKVYKINERVTIPGAETVNGKINPSSVKVLVTADKAGIEYNLSPGVKFRIPGFQGSPKYDAFSGELKETITGGFIGEAQIPTEDDIKSAKEDVKKGLEDALKTQLLFNLPPEVKILNGAYQFSVREESVNDTTDEAGNFTVTAYGEGKLIGFREAELVEVLGKGLATISGGDIQVLNYQVEYGESRVSPGDGNLAVPIKFRSVWQRRFDGAEFKKNAAGKNKSDLKTLIFSIPGVQSGEVNLWPFWVNRVPQNIDRIVVDVK